MGLLGEDGSLVLGLDDEEALLAEDEKFRERRDSKDDMTYREPSPPKVLHHHHYFTSKKDETPDPDNVIFHIGIAKEHWHFSYDIGLNEPCVDESCKFKVVEDE